MSEVPQGTMQEVLDWVGDDSDRAQEALDAERAGQDRSTLVIKLEALACEQSDDETEDTVYAGTSSNPLADESSGSGESSFGDESSDSESTPFGSSTSTGPAGGNLGDSGPSPGEVRDEDQAGGDATVTAPQTGEEAPEEDDEAYQEPEQPTEVVLDPRDEGTLIGPVHARSADIEVSEGDDMLAGDAGTDALQRQSAGGQVVSTRREDDDEGEMLEAEQVDHFQIAGGTNGVILAINGERFALLPQMAASLKTNLDKAVAGLAL
jgi:hypothetical protein